MDTSWLPQIESQPTQGSLILNRDWKIAAILASRVAGDLYAAAESETEVAGRIEARQRRQVAGHFVKADSSAAH